MVYCVVYFVGFVLVVAFFVGVGLSFRLWFGFEFMGMVALWFVRVVLFMFECFFWWLLVDLFVFLLVCIMFVIFFMFIWFIGRWIILVWIDFYCCFVDG